MIELDWLASRIASCYPQLLLFLETQVRTVSTQAMAGLLSGTISATNPFLPLCTLYKQI